MELTRAALDFSLPSAEWGDWLVMRMQASNIQPGQNGFHCESCGFLNRCITGGLPKDELREFSCAVVFYEIKQRGGYVFHQGQPNNGMLLLCSGLIKLVASLPSGEEVILDLVIPGSVISSNLINQRTNYSYAAVVISGSARIAFIKQAALENWKRSQPDILGAILRDYWGKVQTTYTSISHRIYDVRKRFLLLLSRHMSAFEMIHGGELVAIHLSRDELAQLVQTTPETISRLLHCLRDEGLVAPITGKRPIVMKSKVLRDFFTEHDDSAGS